MNFNFTPGYKGQVSIVNLDGGLFVKPQTCKDYLHDAITRQVWPKYAKATSVYDVGRTGKVNLDAPIFVLWTSEKRVERNATKFAQFMNQLETIMGLSMTVTHPVETGITKGAAPFVAEADSWWIKSPVGVSAYLLFLRLSITMKLNESFEDFIERTVDKKNKGGNHSIQRDINYLRIAKDKGHLTGLLEKSLPCFNREEHSDYLLSNHGRGLSMYSLKGDEALPMELSSLITEVTGRTGKTIV